MTNPVSHLFVTVIPSPNALSMCGIISLSVLWCLNLLGTLDIKWISCTFVIIVGMEYNVYFYTVWSTVCTLCISKGSCQCSIAAFESCWHI